MAKGSYLPGIDKTEIGPVILAKSHQTHFKIMKLAVTKCSNIKLKIMGKSVFLLLDSGRMVSLMWQDYFKRYFRPQLGPAEGSVADAHHISDLTSASGGGIPQSRYVELDMYF